MLLRTIAVVSLLLGALSYVLWGFALWAAALLFAGSYLGLLLLAFAITLLKTQIQNLHLKMLFQVSELNTAETSAHFS